MKKVAGRVWSIHPAVACAARAAVVQWHSACAVAGVARAVW